MYRSASSQTLYMPIKGQEIIALGYIEVKGAIGLINMLIVVTGNVILYVIRLHSHLKMKY